MEDQQQFLHIKVTDILDPTNFWAQIGTENDFDNLTEFERTIDEFGRNQPQGAATVSQVHHGKTVLAKMDDKYRRAQVTVVDLMGEEVDVLFLDYNVSERLPISEICTIIPEMATLHQYNAQVHHCRLGGIKPIACVWISRAVEVFTKLVLEELLDCQVIAQDNDKYVLDIFLDKDGDSVKQLGNILVEEGVAQNYDDPATQPRAPDCNIPQFDLNVVRKTHHRPVAKPQHFGSEEEQEDVYDSIEQQLMVSQLGGGEDSSGSTLSRYERSDMQLGKPLQDRHAPMDETLSIKNMIRDALTDSSAGGFSDSQDNMSPPRFRGRSRMKQQARLNSPEVGASRSNSNHSTTDNRKSDSRNSRHDGGFRQSNNSQKRIRNAYTDFRGNTNNNSRINAEDCSASSSRENDLNKNVNQSAMPLERYGLPKKEGRSRKETVLEASRNLDMTHSKFKMEEDRNSSSDREAQDHREVRGRNWKTNKKGVLYNASDRHHGKGVNSNFPKMNFEAPDRFQGDIRERDSKAVNVVVNAESPVKKECEVSTDSSVSPLKPRAKGRGRLLMERGMASKPGQPEVKSRAPECHEDGQYAENWPKPGADSSESGSTVKDRKSMVSAQELIEMGGMFKKDGAKFESKQEVEKGHQPKETGFVESHLKPKEYTPEKAENRQWMMEKLTKNLKTSLLNLTADNYDEVIDQIEKIIFPSKSSFGDGTEFATFIDILFTLSVENYEIFSETGLRLIQDYQDDDAFEHVFSKVIQEKAAEYCIPSLSTVNQRYAQTYAHFVARLWLASKSWEQRAQESMDVCVRRFMDKWAVFHLEKESSELEIYGTCLYCLMETAGPDLPCENLLSAIRNTLLGTTVLPRSIKEKYLQILLLHNSWQHQHKLPYQVTKAENETQTTERVVIETQCQTEEELNEDELLPLDPFSFVRKMLIDLKLGELVEIFEKNAIRDAVLLYDFQDVKEVLKECGLKLGHILEIKAYLSAVNGDETSPKPWLVTTPPAAKSELAPNFKTEEELNKDLEVQSVSRGSSNCGNRTQSQYDLEVRLPTPNFASDSHQQDLRRNSMKNYDDVNDRQKKIDVPLVEEGFDPMVQDENQNVLSLGGRRGINEGVVPRFDAKSYIPPPPGFHHHPPSAVTVGDAQNGQKSYIPPHRRSDSVELEVGSLSTREGDDITKDGAMVKLGKPRHNRKVEKLYSSETDVRVKSQPKPEGPSSSYKDILAATNQFIEKSECKEIPPALFEHDFPPVSASRFNPAKSSKQKKNVSEPFEDPLPSQRDMVSGTFEDQLLSLDLKDIAESFDRSRVDSFDANESARMMFHGKKLCSTCQSSTHETSDCPQKAHRFFVN